jgi:integrin-linked kinase-associated serine/threonine phosphatase 2C
MNQPFNKGNDLFGDLPAPKQKEADPDPKRLKVDLADKVVGPVISTFAASYSVASTAGVAGASPTAAAPARASAAAARASSPAPACQWSVAVRAAHHGTKGRRKTMEDAHLCWDDAELKALHNAPLPPLPDLPLSSLLLQSPALRLGLFGVLDGHGGRRVADLVANLLPRLLVAELAGLASLPSPAANEVVGCLERAVAAADASSQAAARQQGWADGCCCVLLLLVNDFAFVCNLGDSKAVLCRRRKASANTTPKDKRRKCGVWRGASSRPLTWLCA